VSKTTVSGLTDAIRNLDRFDRETRAKIVPKALRMQAVKDARARAPRLTGRLQNAVFVKKRTPQDFTGAQFDVGVRPGKSRKDLTGAYYWLFVEFGRLNEPARPFLRPALGLREPRMVRELAQAISAETARLTRKAARVAR
jgi:HK97 gp10 family phage protein